jgi:ATP-binding cassette subfamily B protein/subfamily B ATP-binding cassette protein MsbA
MNANHRWWVRLLGFARPDAGRLGLLCVLSLAGAGLSMLKPWPLKMIADYVLTGKPLPVPLRWLAVLPGGDSALGLLAWLTASTIVIFLLGWVNTVIATFLQTETAGRLTYRLGAEAFFHLQCLSLRFHHRHATGDLVKRVAVDCRCMRELMIDTCLPAITAVITLVMLFGVMWRLDPTLALLSVGVVPPLAILIKVYARPMMDREYERSQLQGDMMSQAEQVLSALPVIQVFGREEAESQRFVQTTNRAGDAYLRSISTSLRFRTFTGVLLALGTALLMAVGGRHVVARQISLGDLLLFLNYLASLYVPLETMAYLSMSWAAAAAGARRVFELIDSDERTHELPHAVRWQRSPNCGAVAIRFENVSFSYEPGIEVLHDVNLCVRPGEVIAFVGPTGAGKSTIVSLLLRLFDPDQGKITFDGADIRNYELRSLRESVAIVLQEPFLLPISVAENIAYARPGASRQEIVEAAEAADADEFIRKLPQGYDTVIGERGATLSGGQRQRLAIARAFLKDAPILILDEPTSALDSRTEAFVMNATYRLMEGRTTFIVGHRLSTVQGADRIVVLRDGRVVESGSHSELVAARGLYHRLYTIQHPPESEVLQHPVC